MLLAPQHLQQWDRHHDHLVAERFRATQAFEWGLTELRVDAEALRNGRLLITSARGVLPDGTPFALPEDDPLPPARDLEGRLGAKQQSLLVHLGVPAARPGRAAMGLPGAPGAPDERPIETASRNFVLLFPDEALGDHDALPIAELARTADGGYALDGAYVPPCLSIGASETLLRQVHSVHEQLITKSNDLGGQLRQRGGPAIFGETTTGGFWLLHTVNGAIPALAHDLRHRRAHPEQVFLTLASLAGHLCTFWPDQYPKDLPSYDHRALGPSFAAITTIVAKLLEYVVPTKQVSIELEKQRGSMYVGRIQDARLLTTGAGLFLGIRADLDTQILIAEMPRKIKIASLDQIDVLLTTALPGVKLRFLSVPPAGLRFVSDRLYFQLETTGDLWDGIQGARNIAIYMPSDLPGLSLELLGRLE
jgi:type VI secretion system protein ImpJ